ncbi:MAG: pyruvate kinase [Candidatus Omnitrophota bacterium]
MPRTKIICTLGPASAGATVIRNMMLAGMDVARLNFSHGSRDDHLRKLNIIRSLNKKYRRHIRILQDLEGNRIRVGKLENGLPIELRKKETVYLTQEKIPGKDKLIPFDYEGSLRPIGRGQLVFIDDGNIVLKVKAREPGRLKLEVVIGGRIKENKGLNIPGVKLSFPRITPKDKRDLQFGIKHKVDFIAQSFVRSRKDITAVRNLIKDRLPGCRIIAKLENREGIDNIDGILDVSDGIMIARGDMGVSLPMEQLPVIQKLIIGKCNKRQKFVITATQMLENMVEHIRPTRAEVTDIANAILDGTDYLMLSAETAVGKYPVRAVKMMNDIIKYTEGSCFYGIGKYRILS